MTRAVLGVSLALALSLFAPTPAAAQTTYYVRALAAVNVGADGTTNMTTLADMAVTGGSSNQNRAMTNTTAPTGTTRYRVREGASDTRTGQEFIRAYTPTFASATSIAAAATAYADFYMNTTGTSVTAKATLYEYNDTTGSVGAAKGTASFVGNASITTRQTMNNVGFGNAQFTVAAGNRLLVIYAFDMNNSRPAYLWGQGASATPSGFQSFTVTQSAATTITIGNGATEPANSSISNGQTAALDTFTLATSAGTATVTAVTVNLTAGNAALLSLSINSAQACNGVTYGTLASPAAGNNTISLTTNISVTTTAATYYVCVAATTVAINTTVTGNVATVTAASYSAIDNDTTNATVTVTPGTLTLGNGGAEPPNSSITNTQTAALDTFTLATNAGTATVTAIVVNLTAGNAALASLAINSAQACNGTTHGTLASPVAGNNTISLTTNISATTAAATYYVCVTATTVAANTTVTGNVASAAAIGYTATDNDTTNATITVTPPLVVTIDNGASEPPNSSIATSQTAALDTFTLATNAGTATVTAIVVNLTAGDTALTSLSINSAQACNGTGYGTLASPAAGDNTIALGTNISATTTVATFYVCITATTVAANTTVTGNVASATATGYAATDNDTTHATITVTAPPATTAGTASAAADSCSQITVSAPFTGDGNGNGNTTVSRGASPTGPWTAVCSGLTGGTPRVCVDTGRTASTAYYYQVTFADPDGVVGSNPQVIGPYATPACSVSNTTAGTLLAVASSCNTITVSAQYTGDDNANGSVLIEHNTTNTWPGTTDCAAASGPSPRQCVVSGLAANTTYWFRGTFSDSDGVAGTNPTAGVSATTLTSCGADTMPPTVTMLSPSRGATLDGAANSARVQVWDAGGFGASPVALAVDAVSGFSTTGIALNNNLTCGAGCSIYDVALPAQAAGRHYLAIRATDTSGNNAVVTWGFEVNLAGAGTLLRRTTGSQLCLDCHNLQTHGSQQTSTTYGNWSFDCLACHTPHETRNIFLIRPTIDTPASGSKTVDFRVTTGVAANSFATPQASGNGVNVCEVCHTKTRNADASPRARNNAATDWTQHYTSNCVGCHPHGKGFAAGESEGGSTCAGCHKTIWDGMTGAVAKASKHTLGNVLGTNDSFTDSNVTWASPLAANVAAARTCLNMCHDDHVHNATDATPSTSHNYLAYDDAASQASRAATTRTMATKALTDFDNALASGGLCLSCHKNPVESGATPVHPALAQAAYAASAHNTTSTTPGGAWQLTLTHNSNSAFTRNCTKCHWDAADGTTPAVAATGVGAVHSSPNASLLSGTTNPNGTPATFVCYRCHGNGTTGADYSGKNLVTQIAKTGSNHPANADNAHNSATELYNAAFGNTLGVTGRHANCLDCHDPHEAKAGTAASPGNLAGPPLQGAWGAQLSSNPTFWTDTASANFTKKTIVAGTDVEATLCFKCHTKYYWGAGAAPTSPSGGFAETDVAKELNPNNVGNFAGTWANTETAGGFHPVLATAGSNLGAIKLANLVTTNIAWSTTARNLMSCTDCHESETTTDVNGPHGSTAKFILRGPNTKWSSTVILGSSIPAGTFCLNCHQSTFTNSRFPDHSRNDHYVACWNCHAAIPHGGPRPGMLIAPAGASANVGGTIAGWDATAPYWGLGTSSNKLYLVSYPANNTTNWSQNNCGCNGTGH